MSRIFFKVAISGCRWKPDVNFHYLCHMPLEKSFILPLHEHLYNFNSRYQGKYKIKQTRKLQISQQRMNHFYNTFKQCFALFFSFVMACVWQKKKKTIISIQWKSKKKNQEIWKSYSCASDLILTSLYENSIKYYVFFGQCSIKALQLMVNNQVWKLIYNKRGLWDDGEYMVS